MMKGILYDTYIEMKSRKIGIIFGVITVISSLTAFAVGSIDSPISIEDVGPGNPVYVDMMEFFDFYVTVLGAFALFAVVGLFPAMMRKGRADFYLSKPISRHSLFSFRFASIIVTYGCLIVLSSLISHTFFSISSGFAELTVLWVVGFQLSIFLVWLVIVTLAGVLFNSGGVAMMVAFFIWITQMLLQGYEGLRVFESDIPYYIGMGLYYIVPKTSQMAEIGVSLAAGNPVESWMPLWSTALFTLGAFWLALILFRRKDY